MCNTSTFDEKLIIKCLSMFFQKYVGLFLYVKNVYTYRLYDTAKLGLVSLLPQANVR